MQSGFSFRARILLSFWVLIILALLLPSWHYYRNLKQQVVEEAEKSAVLQLNLFHRLVASGVSFKNVQELQQWVAEIVKDPSLRLTYIAEGGRVIADSRVPFSKLDELDNHADRPEIAQAGAEDIGLSIRFSRTAKEELVFVARRIQPQGNIPPGILRLAFPFAVVKSLLERMWNSFMVVTALIFISSLFLSYFLIRQLRAPIDTLVGSMNAVASGDFKKRIHFAPGQEFFPLGQAINRMTSSIDKRIQTIEEERRRLDAVFNGMREGVMVLDSRGKIQSVNHALSKLFPNANQCLGRTPLETFMNLELQEACDRALSQGQSSRGSSSNHLEIVLPGDRIYDVNLVGLLDPQRGMGAVVVFHDISELKRLETVRRDFVANVSHELRTPLTSIKGYAETLLAGPEPDPETRSSFLEIILKNTNHMVAMVDDLLRLAGLETRHRVFEPAPLNALDALAAAWKECETLAGERRIALKTDFPPDGVVVSGNRDQIVQVFRNLLENGVKYSPEGGTLVVSCRKEAGKAVFSVKDKGPGISRQHLQRVFERFYRVEKHRGAHLESTGLGLAICRHIVQNHGGKIWVESPDPDDAKGSVFSFTLFLDSSDDKSDDTA